MGSRCADREGGLDSPNRSDEKPILLINCLLQPVDLIPFILIQPMKAATRHGLTHRPAIEIVRVPIHDVRTWESWIVSAAHVFVVRFGVPSADHRDAATKPRFQHFVHRLVFDESQLAVRDIQHRIPTELWCRHIMRGIELIVLHGHLTECLEHIGQEQHISYTTKCINICIGFQKLN